MILNHSFFFYFRSFKKNDFSFLWTIHFFRPSFAFFWIKYPFPHKRTCQIFPWDFRKMNIIEGLHSMVLVNYIYVLSLGVSEIFFCIIPHSTPQFPKVPQSTQQYPVLPNRYGEFKLTLLPSPPPLSDQLISMKPAFSCMKIEQNWL